MLGEMTGKVCLVTGATSGIGRAAASALAQQGATIVLMSRNAAKCAQVAAEMQSASGNQNVGFIAADLSPHAAVRRRVPLLQEQQHESRAFRRGRTSS